MIKMKKILAISLLILLIVSIASGCIGGDDEDDGDNNTPSGTTNPASTTNPPTSTMEPSRYWELYEFEVGDSFTYEVFWNGPDFNINGEFNMEFLSCATHDYRVRYYGNYTGSMSASFNTSFNTNQEEFYQNFMQSMTSSNPMVTPLFMFTIVAPWWGPYFSNSNIALGSNWSITVDGNTSTFSFENTCRHAGIDGYMGVWTFSGNGYNSQISACISPDFPLALYSEYIFDQPSEQVTYRSQLVDWS